MEQRVAHVQFYFKLKGLNWQPVSFLQLNTHYLYVHVGASECLDFFLFLKEMKSHVNPVLRDLVFEDKDTSENGCS